MRRFKTNAKKSTTKKGKKITIYSHRSSWFKKHAFKHKTLNLIHINSPIQAWFLFGGINDCPECAFLNQGLHTDISVFHTRNLVVSSVQNENEKETIATIRVSEDRMLLLLTFFIAIYFQQNIRESAVMRSFMKL